MATGNLQQLAKDLRANLEDLGYFLTVELQKQLRGSGHEATGKLSKSIEHEVQDYTKGLELTISYLRYGIFVNDGVAASRVPFGQKTGAKFSLYIQGLIEWVKVKRLAQGVEAVGLAFGIARKHKQVGISTPASRRFAPNGVRNGFRDRVLAAQGQRITDIIQDGLSESVNFTINRLAQNITKNI
jgi:hypothetical protein